MTTPYQDIIDLPHHVSKRHPPMPREKRAAQFAPFAALEGFEELIAETARSTEPRRELDEHEQARLDAKLQALAALLPDRPAVKLEFFVPDATKPGGSYSCVQGHLAAIDTAGRRLVLAEGQRIKIAEITALDSPALSNFDSME